MSGRKKTVYIIEDDHEILLLISSLLKKNNYDTVIDYNGNDFDVTRLPCPDLYIIDINLIDKHGGDLCAQIKKICPDIPVILMSANSNLEDIALAVKADRVLRKPFSTKHVIDAVTAFISDLS